MAPTGNNRNGTFSESELRAVEHSVFGGRRVLWAGVLAVFLPLAVLLALQYWWLADLERNSALAREATLKNYLETITKDVYYFYWKISERALNLPPEVFGEKKTEKAAGYFKKKEIEGARQLFIVSFLSREPMLFYDREKAKMVIPKHSDETVAVWAAASPWSYLRKKGTKIEKTTLSVDQHDQKNRIIILPITDEHFKLVGLAGMIVDQKYFEKVVLPKAIESSLPKFKDEEKHELLVIVRDGQKRQILPHDIKANPKKDRVSRSFAFVFTDWYISLQGDFASPEKWARANFAYNMTLSVILAAVLLGGIALTIRTALREMKLSAMKNEFVSNVSHELRTPLSSIRVFGEFMRRGRVEDQEKVREYGSYIETESRRLTQLINNILDFSRIESGRKVYMFEDADLEEILAGTLATFTVRLRDKGFDVSYQGPDEPLPEVEVDPNAIDRAVANLLDNAVKYSDGDRAIQVTLDRTNGEATISVTDHGIGIPREEQEKIFERFHRVSTGLVHDVKGSGLGLSLVRHIAEAHGGTVTVESEIGTGSTFTIHLPLLRSEGDQA
ncbi:MAG: HAMP domain-containing histidine kinase [Acidobacteriota bacterium]|jgi:signal transduction histidine kinase|nr:HAMP domain-containing histidine kinase [Acidobacteriota bacterium]